MMIISQIIPYLKLKYRYKPVVSVRMNGEDDPEMRARAREERQQIVEKYDRGREDGAVIDDWEDPRLEIYHTQDR